MKKIIYYTLALLTIAHLVTGIIFLWLATVSPRVCEWQVQSCTSPWHARLVPVIVGMVIAGLGWLAADDKHWDR